jgi:hypothetical protein
MRVQALVAEPPVEALDEGILDGLARSNELEPDVGRILPRVHRAADELAAVVRRNRGRRPAPNDMRTRTALRLVAFSAAGADAQVGQ